MEMIKVQSSAISQIGYKRRTMEIQFNTGRKYQFKHIPRKLFDQFRKSDSIGYFFVTEIKSKFKSVEI